MSERRGTPNDVSELGVVVVDPKQDEVFWVLDPNEDPQQASWSMTRPTRLMKPMTNLQTQDRPNFSDTPTLLEGASEVGQ
jgi:hypothetical protein